MHASTCIGGGGEEEEGRFRVSRILEHVGGERQRASRATEGKEAKGCERGFPVMMIILFIGGRTT